MKKDINNRKDIELLVNSFYEKVQEDEKIGYIFTDIAKVNWQLHLPKMYDFWETILFGQKGFKGNPMEVHFKLNKIHPLLQEHFERWKSLFYDTINEHFEGKFAELAKEKAQSIADLMLFKMNPDSHLFLPGKSDKTNS